MLQTLLLAAACAASPGDPGLPLRLQDEVPSDHAFIDFGRLEGAAWIGIVGSSGDFESDPQVGAGALLRAPMPWLSRDVFGMSADDLGLFVQVAFSRIDRDLDPEPENPDGAVLSAALGLDYTLLRDESCLLIAQVGLQFVSFDDIFETDDGVGFLLGLMGGLSLGENFWLVADPQLWLGEGGDFLYALGAGVLISF